MKKKLLKSLESGWKKSVNKQADFEVFWKGGRGGGFVENGL